MLFSGGLLFVGLICSAACQAQSTVPITSRLDCFPDPNASQDACIARGCIWDNTGDQTDQTIPLCYFPTNTGYVLQKNNGDGSYVLGKSANSPANPFGADIQQLNLKTTQLGQTLKVSIGVSGRYIPPVPLLEDAMWSASDSFNFVPNNDTGTFYFNVNRKSNNRNIFDTSIGGLLFSDKFIQIATYLPSKNFYGLGEEVHHTIRHDFSVYTTWGLFDRDMAPDSVDPNDHNLYGVHPFYMVVEPDGQAHGVLIFNSNAQEFVTGPAPHLVYRTIGGQLDLYFFPGPNPEDVIQQYNSLIGRPFLPPLWSLGFQLSRWGYNSLSDAQEIIQNNIDKQIPLDVIYFDIDYMERYKDFTIGPNFDGLGDYVSDLKKKHNIKTFLMFDPAIEVDYPTYQRAIEQNASFISWPRADMVQNSVNSIYPLTKNTNVMLGVVWPDKHVAFPDFLDQTEQTVNWWADEIGRFWDVVNFSGLWIDMNEPSDFSTNKPHVFSDVKADKCSDNSCLETLKCPLTGPDSQYDKPPYQTYSVYEYGGDTVLSTKTLCMTAVAKNGNEYFYNTKNLFGWSESVATKKAMDAAMRKRGHKERNVVFSRSTYVSSGRYGGHWLGDNNAHYQDMKTTVIGVQEFNMFGVTYVGSDVCGFNGNTNEELCLRWQQLGSFHSFFRNHNTRGNNPQDPAQWTSVTNAAIKANAFRYKNIPYLYTLHYKASLFGGTVVRPVFFEFPNDSEVLDLGHQFMWGSALMIVPVLDAGVSTVRAYLPQADEGWYSMYDFDYGAQMPSGYSVFPAPTTYNTPSFIRGGSIIPRLTTTSTTLPSNINNEHTILIALDSNLSARGDFYYDEGNPEISANDAPSTYTHLNYYYESNTTSSTLGIRVNTFVSDSKGYSINTIEIFGYPYHVDYSSFKLNGYPKSVIVAQSSYSPFSKILRVTFIQARKSANTKFPEIDSGDSEAHYTWQHLIN
uniref:P-type domain-containing protein n=1 Tax=Rhabditophanes sp. KR3021 TaxID=114890 RepID=A0AC35U2U3_9BILA